MRNWNELSMAEKADVMKLAIEGGVYDLDAIRDGYNEYAKGGKIHIAPSKRGTFTAAASKHGKSVQAFASQVLAHPENYSPAMRKKANFARNASKWKHGDGGGLFDNIVSSVDEGAYKVSQYLMGLAGHSDGASVKENGEPRESIAQASYLTPRYIQKKKFLQYGYTEAPGDYGLVKKAVGNRKLPVYQKNPDVITRDKLNVIGNTYLWMGKSEDDLVHAGSNPTALYHDDKGNIYQKGWDLNDYGATSGGAYTNYNLLDKIGANILDFVGSPVVVTTGIRPTYNWETKGMSTLANPKSELAPIVDKYLKSKGLVRHTRIDENGTLTGNRVDYIGLPEVVITGKKENKALGGNLFDGTTEDSQQMQIGSEYWRQQALKPTFTERLAEFNSNRTIERTLPEIVVTPNKYTSPVYWRKALGIQNENTKEIAKEATDLVLSNIEKDKEIINQRNKAIIRANRNTKTPLYNSTAELQEALFKIGAFDSIKDRKGRAVTYNTAVDGIRGRMTNAAIRKAREMGYDVDVNSGSVSKHDNNTSEYTGLEAIVNHKVDYNVQNPYIVVDKANNLMQIMRGKDVLEKHEITSSLNKGDGWYPLLGHAGLPNMPRTTGAGVYTVKGIPTSAYPRDMDEKQPMFVLYAGNTNSTMAIHEPVNAKRRALFENNNTFDNRASYGCISPKPGIVGRLYNDKVIQTGDSVYVLPEIPGNYLYEKDGKLQMHYGENNPVEFTTESGFRGKFRYNKNK